MSPTARPATCPHCGSTDLEIITASRDGETADEIIAHRCRTCGQRFTITAKLD
jgi:transcriptional regulator NrdR family protein